MSVTLKDISQATGFSISTVSRVASGKGYVSPEAKAAIEQAMAQLGYTHREQNHRYNDDASAEVLVMIGGVKSSLASESVELICDELVRKHKQPIVGITGFSVQRELSYLTRAAERHYFGVITLTLTECPEVIHLLKTYPCPVVMLARYIPIQRVDCLHADYYKMGFNGAEYFIERGHRRIAFLGGSTTSTITQDKIMGFQDCMSSHGIEVPEGYVMHSRRLDYTDGYALVKKVLSLDPRPTAVLGSNDSVDGLLLGLLRKGVRVPEDISIVSCDDTPFSQNDVVPITAMHVDYAQMCSDAVKTLFRRRRNPSAPFTQTYYDPEIVERKSVANLNVEVL